MKLCPYCSKEMELTAVVCQHCGRDWQTGVPTRESDASPVQTAGLQDAPPALHSSAANIRRTGVAYVATTGGLIATITASYWCWESQNVGSHPSMTLHDVCLTIWAISGILLALSQIIFVAIGLRIKDSAITTMDAQGQTTRESRASVAKVVILVGGSVILITIAMVLFALSTMPS